MHSCQKSHLKETTCVKLREMIYEIQHSLSIRPLLVFARQCLLVGADVNHARQLDPRAGEPAIAALVGSLDPHAATYCAFTQLQNNNEEIVQVTSLPVVSQLVICEY